MAQNRARHGTGLEGARPRRFSSLPPLPGPAEPRARVDSPPFQRLTLLLPVPDSAWRGQRVTDKEFGATKNRATVATVSDGAADDQFARCSAESVADH